VIQRNSSKTKRELKQQGQIQCVEKTCCILVFAQHLSSSRKQLKYKELCNSTPVCWQRPHLSSQNICHCSKCKLKKKKSNNWQTEIRKCLPYVYAVGVMLPAQCLLHTHKPTGEGHLFCMDVCREGVVTRHRRMYSWVSEACTTVKLSALSTGKKNWTMQKNFLESDLTHRLAAGPKS